MNPLLSKSTLAFNAIEFSKIKSEHYLPAIHEAISLARKRIHDIKNSTQISFKSVIDSLEISTRELDDISSIFFNLHSAEATEEIQKLAEEISPLLKQFRNDILLDDVLFKKVEAVYQNKQNEKLDVEEKMSLERTYRDFHRNGAKLDDNKKKDLRKLDEELAMLNLKFGDNLLKATNKFELEITNPIDLDGLPQLAIETAKEEAIKQGKNNSWIFTLKYPSYFNLLAYCKNEKIREKIFKALNSKAFKDEFDNTQVVKDIVNLRLKRANLLGYKNHAEYILEDRMAENVIGVDTFVNSFFPTVLNKAKENFEDLRHLKEEMGHGSKLYKWDTNFYYEILQKNTLSIDDEILRPYFQLEKVIDGVFLTAEKLYNIEFKENKNIDRYHSDVLVYEVFDVEENKTIAIFYADFFPRDNKRGGAWATTFKDHHYIEKSVQIPHVSIVCNFPRPSSSTPSLLSLDEVKTLFHEFGHALHCMFSKNKYRSLAGANVFWDFVELPSQIMENWVLEKECLDFFACHYKTGEKIPKELVLKLSATDKFMAGLTNLRQLTLGILDMKWHEITKPITDNVEDFESKILSPYSILEDVKGTNISCSFSHIFDGGYSAGYYSYKWAEVLDADAFEHFKETGIFNQATAKKFRENILSKGGSEHPSILYERFRGRKPDPAHLFERSGLVKL